MNLGEKNKIMSFHKYPLRQFPQNTVFEASLTDWVISVTWPSGTHSPSLTWTNVKSKKKDLCQETWSRGRSSRRGHPPSNQRCQEGQIAADNGRCTWRRSPCRGCTCLQNSHWASKQQKCSQGLGWQSRSGRSWCTPLLSQDEIPPQYPVGLDYIQNWQPLMAGKIKNTRLFKD